MYPAEVKTEVAETKPAPVADPPKKSFLVDDDAPIEEAPAKEKAFVPNESFAIRREREKRRELERELEELRAAKAAAPEPDELDEVGNDDYLTKAQSFKLAEKAAAKILAERQAQQAQQVEHQQTKARLIASEQAFREKMTDYDTVIETALNEEVLLPEDRQRAYASKDPAKTLYLLAKRNLEAVGVVLPQSVPVPSSVQNPNINQSPAAAEADEDVPDDMLLDSLVANRGG